MNWQSPPWLGYPWPPYPSYPPIDPSTLTTELRRSSIQIPIGLQSKTVRAGRRAKLRATCQLSVIPTDLTCAANRARRRRSSEPTLEAVLVGGIYVVEFPEDKLPPPEKFTRSGERLDVAFLIEEITVGRARLLRGEKYLADSFYCGCDHPPLKSEVAMPGDEIIISVKNISRVSAVLRATLWGIDACSEKR